MSASRALSRIFCVSANLRLSIWIRRGTSRLPSSSAMSPNTTASSIRVNPAAARGRRPLRKLEDAVAIVGRRSRRDKGIIVVRVFAVLEIARDGSEAAGRPASRRGACIAAGSDEYQIDTVAVHLYM